MTPPRTPRDLRETIRDMRVILTELERDYPEAFELGYSSRSSGDSGKVKAGPSDPTSSAYAVNGRTRYLLRRVNKKVTVALDALEDARDDLSDIWEQGPRAMQGYDRAGVVRLMGRLR